jgi:hypothetical protein
MGPQVWLDFTTLLKRPEIGLREVANVSFVLWNSSSTILLRGSLITAMLFIT